MLLGWRFGPGGRFNLLTGFRMKYEAGFYWQISTRSSSCGFLSWMELGPGYSSISDVVLFEVWAAACRFLKSKYSLYLLFAIAHYFEM